MAVRGAEVAGMWCIVSGVAGVQCSSVERHLWGVWLREAVANLDVACGHAAPTGTATWKLDSLDTNTLIPHKKIVNKR